MKKDQIFGLIGAVMLIIGVFLPLVKLPFVGTMNYFQNGQGDGVFVIALGGIALVLTLLNLCKYNIIPALISLAILIYTYSGFEAKMQEAKESFSKQDFGMFQGVADMAMQSISIEYGFAVIALGGIFALISGIVSK